MKRLLLLAIASLVALTAASRGAAAEDDLVHIVSNVTYDIRPDQGPVTVTWDVTFENRDPATDPTGNTAQFYDSVTLPVLNGASELEAVSGDGDDLDANVPEGSENAVIGAVVEFAEPVFYQETYQFTLTYELSDVRQRSLLVTPFYVYLPIIAGGDEATITVNTPTDAAWPATLEPAGDCTQAANVFTCSGSPSSYFAAVAEVSRPDAMATTSFPVQLSATGITTNVTFFQGEDAFAQHFQELATAALPLIEEAYGFPYPAPAVLNVVQGGRQVVLGYEGITQCEASACNVTVSPVADDLTLIHELAHLWSGIYAKRWLSEGFAQLIAEEVAGLLPEGLVRGVPPFRAPSSATLSLDDWGSVTTVVGATEEDLEIENAGYDRSLRFLIQLRFETGDTVPQDVNAAIAAAIAAGGRPATSRTFMDIVEAQSGQNVDELFLEWVFPPSYEAILNERREAINRLSAVTAALAEAGLTNGAPEAIRADIAAWRFNDALAALDEAEAGIATYTDLLADLDSLRDDATDLGLVLPNIAEDDLLAWEFSTARLEIERAKLALADYAQAKSKLDEPRNLIERFGLLGKDPDATLERAAVAFAFGDFERARELAGEAEDEVDGAAGAAIARLAIVFAVAGFFALVVLAVVWIQHHREQEFA